jgi:hypothetical protein
MTAEVLFNQLSSELCIEIAFQAFQKQKTVNSQCPHCGQRCKIISKTDIPMLELSDFLQMLSPDWTFMEIKLIQTAVL